MCSAALLVATPLSRQARAAEADPYFNVNINRRPLADALVDLAVQTGLSIGGVDPSRCGARNVTIQGRLTSEGALRQLLAGSRCDIRRFDDRSFRLDLKPPAKPAAKPILVSTAEHPVLPQQDEVLITRRPVSLSSTPRAISVVPGSVLSGSDLDLSNIASRVPGMSVTNLGPGRDKILLRGVSDSILTGRTQSTVGLYLDDAAITYNAPDPDLLLVDMARVEVLKGPQGALYGQGSLSGIVRLVTNKPRSDAFDADVGASIGMTEGGSTSWRGTAMVNLPLLSGKGAVRTVLYDEEYGGFINDEINGHKITNTTTRTGGRLAFAWSLTPDTTLTLSGIAQRLNSENSQYVYGQRSTYRRELAVAEPHDNAFENTSAGLQTNLNGNTLKISLSHLNHRLSTGYDAQPVQRYVSIPTSGVLFYAEDQAMSLSTAEISLLSPSNDRLRWLGGLFYAHSTENFDPNLSDIYTKTTLYHEMRIDRVNDMAAFGYVGYDPTPHWTVSLGLRATYADHDTTSLINNVHLTGYSPAGQINGSINAHHIAYSALASYKPHDGLLFYLQAADGFRTGGFNTTTQQVTAIPAVYSGDALSSTEAGFKVNTSDNRLRFNVSVFHVDWDDIQSDQLRATGLPIVVNIGNGTNTGVESEMDWMFNTSLHVHAAAQFNNPRLNKPNPLFSKDKDGGMPFIARRTLSLALDWNQALRRLVFENSATLSYRSQSPLNYGPLRSVLMDGYTNLDLASFANVGKLRVGVRVTNATGVTSNSFAYGNPFSVDGSSQITPLRPRTMWLSISRRY